MLLEPLLKNEKHFSAFPRKPIVELMFLDIFSPHLFALHRLSDSGILTQMNEIMFATIGMYDCNNLSLLKCYRYKWQRTKGG